MPQSTSRNSPDVDLSNVKVEFRDVNFRVGHREIVSQVNLTINQGEALLLLGRSGSGKTTTLKLINRLLIPTSGQVLVGDRSTQEWDAISLRRKIGYAIQETGLFPHFTVGENVGLVPSLLQWSRPKLEARVYEMLNLVGLEPEVFAHRYPQQLSGGQRQRVGIARALAADPPILLMDEPFGALDQLTKEELQEELLEIWNDSRCTVLMVTHDIDEALFLSDRLVMMTNGPSANIGEILTIPFDRPRNRDLMMEDPLYYDLRNEALDFLYNRFAHDADEAA